jgi:hypothetical protein
VIQCRPLPAAHTSAAIFVRGQCCDRDHLLRAPEGLPNRPRRPTGAEAQEAGAMMMDRSFARKRSRLNIDPYQPGRNVCGNNAIMSSNDLVQKCNEAIRLGVDFPTLWHTTIKPHSSVIGPPVQRLDGNRTYLEVPLLRGNWLVIDNELRMVSIR